MKLARFQITAKGLVVGLQKQIGAATAQACAISAKIPKHDISVLDSKESIKLVTFNSGVRVFQSCRYDWYMQNFQK